MHHSVRRAATLLLLTLLAAAACDKSSTEPPGNELPFDVIEVADTADALVLPLQPILAPSVSLESAFNSLTDQGVTFDRTPSPLLERARSVTGLDARVVARSVEFPPDIIGKTFVYDSGTRDWKADTLRAGAPTDGVRIIWYATDVTGAIGIPIQEMGYIDLTDQDEGILNQLGVRIVDTTGASDLLLADFTQGYWQEGDVSWSEHFEAAGSYANGTRSTSFDLSSDATGNHDTGDQDFNFDITLDGPSTSYTMSLVGSDDGTTGASEESYSFTVIMNGVTTRLDLDLTVPSDAPQEGTGTIFYRSEPVVDLTVNGTSFQYSPPDGGDPFNSTQTGQIDVLVQTLLQDGYIVLLNLPLLFL